MENLNTQMKTTTIKVGIYEQLVLGLLKNFTVGELTLIKENGDKLIIGNGNGIKAQIRVNNKSFYKKCALYGDVGFGEAYCDGDWDSSDLTRVIRWVIQNVDASGVMSGSKTKNLMFNFLEKINKAKHFLKKNNKANSIKNVAHHYDLSNDFYKLMLDETMSYSCAIFNNKEDTLKDAQLNKLKTICEDLAIAPGDHILEIGCGWGGFAKYAAENYDCKVTGITISVEQFNFATNMIQNAGLDGRVNIILQDYRDLTGQYDKVVSIEMIEQVGDEFIPEYFEKIDQLLKTDGVAVIQAITSPDSRYEEFKKGVDFIQKHIFPGTLLPSVTRMLSACQQTGSLQLYNLRDIGPHYVRTLRIWSQKVASQKDKIKELGMDEFFFRQWNYYLFYCEAAFRERNISDVQITLIKPNATSYRNEDWDLVDFKCE
jgi:cyclopropane-fatty-acyl-phospholipid synthase